jgi:hypothetical protein
MTGQTTGHSERGRTRMRHAEKGSAHIDPPMNVHICQNDTLRFANCQIQDESNALTKRKCLACVAMTSARMQRRFRLELQ